MAVFKPGIGATFAGLVTISSGGLVVAAGTSSLQAITGTTLVLSSGLTVASGTSALQAVTGTTFTASSRFVAGTTSYYPGASTSVTTSATAIYTLSLADGLRMIVYGGDGTNYFMDEIRLVAGAPIQTASATTLAGSPASRTYTYVGGVVKLAMGSGTYTIKTAPQELA